MGGVVDWLSGASGSANNAAGKVGSYYGGAEGTTDKHYQNAEQETAAAYAAGLPQVNQQYTNAEGQLLNATGSPAASDFINLQNEALQPQFKQQQAALPGNLAALGLSGSGAAGNAEATLSGDQSAALAGADAPLYSSALSAYANLLGSGAAAGANYIGQGTGAQANLYGNQAGAFANLAGQGAGAQGQTYTNTYNQSIADFYSALQSAGADATTAATGVPAGGGGSAPYSPTTFSAPGSDTTSGQSIDSAYQPTASYSAYGGATAPAATGAAPTTFSGAVNAGNGNWNPYGSTAAPQSSTTTVNGGGDWNPYS